ncbi:MAG: CrcB family protein [Puniceicoccaceae bacterium]
MPQRFTAADILFISLGGTMGSLLRWWIGLGFMGNFPVPTILVNILGAAALGVLHASQHRLHPQGRYLYMVGFCGSFTTISLFSLETLQLFEAGRPWAALVNLFLPVGIAIVVVVLVIRVVEKSIERRRQ